MQNDDGHSKRKDVDDIMEPANDSSGEDESFKTCDNVTDHVTVNAPPEIIDDTDTSNSDNGSDLFLSDNNDDDDSDISDPGRDRDVDDDRNVETSFQRELLDYLGSLFSVNSRIRLRESRQPVTVTDDQLGEYKSLLEKVEKEMKILGVRSMTEAASSDQSIARNLYYLLAARERGDWSGCRRYLRVVPMWTFETCVKEDEMSVDSDSHISDTKEDELSLDGDHIDEDTEFVQESVEEERNESKREECLDNHRAIKEATCVEEGLDIGAQRWAMDSECDDYTDEFLKRKIKDNTEKVKYVAKNTDEVKTTTCSKENVESGACKRSFQVKNNNKVENSIGKKKFVLSNISKKSKLYLKKTSSLSNSLPHVTQVVRAGQNDLKSAVYGSRWAVSRLGLESRFPVHEGCVNTLHFNSSGDWIASGSDDRHVVITDWQSNVQISRFTVGHASNIFQVRFLPCSNDLELVTCSRDRSVRYAALSSTGQLQYSRLLNKHDDSCHKMDMPLDQPGLVISAGEDCRVLWNDVRTAKDSGQLCLVDKVPLYSISCNPVRSQEFCVAGKDNHVYVYDRRKPHKSLYKLIPDFDDQSRSGYHVTSVTYSGDGNSVLASYNDEDIYLMSARPVNGSTVTEHKYSGHRNVQTVTGVSFYGPNQEYIVSGSNDGHVVLWERETEALVNWFLADEAGVVNVLEPHPFMPVLATSGLDHDIKLWSMLSAEDKESRRRAVTLDGEGFIERDPETSRIDLAWKTLSDKNLLKSSTTEESLPKLPFNLHNLQVVTALNWKMRADSYPYSYDTTLENLMFMSRRHPDSQFRNIIVSDSDSGESMDNGSNIVEEIVTSGVPQNNMNVDEGPSNNDQPNEDSADRGRPDGCRSS